MNGKYGVHFYCHWANYHWVVVDNLTIEEAEKIIVKKNRNGIIHKYRGCCQFYAQKDDKNE